MHQKGFIIIGYVVGLLAIGLVTTIFVSSIKGNPPSFLTEAFPELFQKQEVDDSERPFITEPTTTPESTAGNYTVVSPTTKAITKPTVNKTSTPTSVPQTTSTPATSSTNNTCQINALADSSSQNSVRLSAGASSKNGSYIKGAQWDFDGNGSWDTDMNIANQNATHAYPEGTHTVKLKTLMSDGSTTDVCSKSVTTPFGFTISITGVVYEDRNCNDMREPSEKGLSGVLVGMYPYGSSALTETTTDSSGSYSLNYVLAAGNSLTVQPYDKPLENYGVTQSRHFVTLGATQKTINMDLGQVPSPVADYCQ